MVFFEEIHTRHAQCVVVCTHKPSDYWMCWIKVRTTISMPQQRSCDCMQYMKNIHSSIVSNPDHLINQPWLVCIDSVTININIMRTTPSCTLMMHPTHLTEACSCKFARLLSVLLRSCMRGLVPCGDVSNNATAASKVSWIAFALQFIMLIWTGYTERLFPMLVLSLNTVYKIRWDSAHPPAAACALICWLLLNSLCIAKAQSAERGCPYCLSPELESIIFGSWMKSSPLLLAAIHCCAMTDNAFLNGINNAWI